MNVVDVTGLKKSYGSREILSGVSFAIGDEDKIGLVGVNGSGKSSLLQILAGLEPSDGGTLFSRRGAAIGYLPQEPLLDESLTVVEEIEQGLVDIRRALAEFDTITARLAANPVDSARLLLRQGELTTWIEHHGGWHADHRVSEVMTHLQIPDHSQRITELSGGTRRRVALARLLLQAPDILMLDEPTNHLDADTTQWLQEYLKAYLGAVLLITHDRYFLDQVVGRIIELEGGVIYSFNGGYSNYLVEKEARLDREAEGRSRLLNLLRVENAWMQRQAPARSTKQKARIERYQDIRERSAGTTARSARIGFQDAGRLGGTILELLDLGKSYGNVQMVSNLTLRLKRGDRIGVIGPNGCGKTTLLRMVLGEETPDAGSVVIGRQTRMAYFDQHREVLEPEETIYGILGEGDYVHIGGERRHKIGYLEEFLFAPSDRMRRIGTLSGGEKSRLILARLMLQDANLLILDEPTNDLDIPTLQLLDNALTHFAGCALVVTHDRFFLDKVATGILAFEGNGRVVFYEGNYSLYRELRGQFLSSSPEFRGEKQQLQKQEPPRKPVKLKKGLPYAERLELVDLENGIAALEQRKVEVESILGDPAAYESAAGGIAAVSGEFDQLENELSRLYGRWEELELKREG